VCVILPGKREDKIIRRMIDIIREEGLIFQWELVKRANISIRDFNELKGFMLYDYYNEIDFNKKTKHFKLKLESLDLNTSKLPYVNDSN